MITTSDLGDGNAAGKGPRSSLDSAFLVDKNSPAFKQCFRGKKDMRLLSHPRICIVKYDEQFEPVQCLVESVPIRELPKRITFNQNQGFDGAVFDLFNCFFE